jgi:hypothetical protein
MIRLQSDNDNSNTGIENLGFGANNLPNRLSSGVLANPGPEGWFDPGAFAIAYG